jgi:UDP-GlcNAc:undecaprenyl-phosphate GlcNAc-1-phosphate transferase
MIQAGRVMFVFYSFLGFVIAALLILVSIPAARNTKLVSRLDFRRRQTGSIPQLGGIGIATSLVFLSPFYFTYSLSPILVPAMVIFLLGVVDDYFELSAKPKLLGQLATVAVFLFLAPIEQLLFYKLGWGSLLTYGLSALFVLGIINSFNMIDGIDGLATGYALLISLAMLIVLPPVYHSLIFVLIGATSAVLVFNLPEAKIYLGDSGSTLLGFVLSSTVMFMDIRHEWYLDALVPFYLFALCEVDFVLVTFRRWRSSRPLLKGDNDHLHHRLQRLGVKKLMVISILLTAAFVSICLGLQLHLATNGSSIVSIGVATFLMLMLPIGLSALEWVVAPHRKPKSSKLLSDSASKTYG